MAWSELGQEGLPGLDGRALDLSDQITGEIGYNKQQALMCVSSDFGASRGF